MRPDELPRRPTRPGPGVDDTGRVDVPTPDRAWHQPGPAPTQFPDPAPAHRRGGGNGFDRGYDDRGHDRGNGRGNGYDDPGHHDPDYRQGDGDHDPGYRQGDGDHDDASDAGLALAAGPPTTRVRAPRRGGRLGGRTKAAKAAAAATAVGAAGTTAHRAGARGRAPRPTEPAPRPELPYVPAFDGIRAIALLGVLAFHQGFGAARGGFLGLSSFFTLSGFLVATFALAEWAQSGRLEVARLWEHRARRILPALLFTVGLVVALQVALRVGAGPGYRADVLAALGQVLNWRFALNGDGFASTLTDPSPVQHLWPLSMLVQITLVFPLVFVGVMRVTGRRWRTAGALFAAAAAASFAAAWFTAGRSGNDGLAYYGTHTRVGELLVGVVLAYVVLSPSARRLAGTEGGLRVIKLGAPAALVGLGVLWHSTGLFSTNLFGGITALNAVLTAWVIFAATVPGPAAAALGSAPLRVLGRLSYSAYLLSWPLFLLLDQERTGFDGPVLFAVRVAATLVAAAAVTYGLERPVRRGAAVPLVRLAAGFAVCAGLVAAAAIVLPEQPPRGVTLSIGDANGAGRLDVVVPGGGEEALSVAIVGGTLADSLVPGFEAWNAENPDAQVRVHTHTAAACPLSAPGPVQLAGEVIGEETSCIGFAPRLPRLLDAADPDVVVVVPSVGDLGEREIDRQWLHAGDPVYDRWLRSHLADVADTLEDADVPVVWATAPHVRLAPGGGADGDWTTVAANDPARVDRLNEIIRSVAARRDTTTVADLGAWAQRLPRGEFAPAYRADGRDLTADGATQAAAWLVPELQSVLD